MHHILHTKTPRQAASVEVQLREPRPARGRQFCLGLHLLLGEQVLNSGCLDEQVAVQLVVVRGAAVLALLEELQVLPELVLADLAAELLHVEEQALQGLGRALLVPLVPLREAQEAPLHRLLEDAQVHVLLQRQRLLPHLTAHQDALEVQHPLLYLLPLRRLLEQFREVGSQEPLGTRGQLAVLLRKAGVGGREAGVGGRRARRGLGREAGEGVLEGAEGGGDAGELGARLLRTALAVLVQVLPVVLERLLGLGQQSHDVLRGGLLLLVPVGGRLQQRRVAAVSDRVLETFVPLPAELLLQLAVVALGVGRRRGFARGQEQRSCQRHPRLSHRLFYYYNCKSTNAANVKTEAVNHSAKTKFPMTDHSQFLYNGFNSGIPLAQLYWCKLFMCSSIQDEHNNCKMVRQEKAKSRPRTKTTRAAPAPLLKRLKRSTLPPSTNAHGPTEPIIPVQHYLVHLPQERRLQPESAQGELQHPQGEPHPHAHSRPISIPASGSLLLSETCENESVLAQPSDAEVAWPSFEEAEHIQLQGSFGQDYELEEDSSDDIWRPRELMFLWRRPEGDQHPPLQQKHMQGPVYGFEAKLEREDTEMKAEEEGEEWEDDLEFYSSIEQCK